MHFRLINAWHAVQVIDARIKKVVKRITSSMDLAAGRLGRLRAQHPDPEGLVGDACVGQPSPDSSLTSTAVQEARTVPARATSRLNMAPLMKAMPEEADEEELAQEAEAQPAGDSPLCQSSHPLAVSDASHSTKGPKGLTSLLQVRHRALLDMSCPD
jgi:hypothetical protein